MKSSGSRAAACGTGWPGGGDGGEEARDEGGFLAVVHRQGEVAAGGLERLVGERREELREVGAVRGGEAVEEVVLRALGRDVELAVAGEVEELGAGEGGEDVALGDGHGRAGWNDARARGVKRWG